MSKTVQEAHDLWVASAGMKDREQRWDDYCNIRDGLPLGSYEHIRARKDALEASANQERAEILVARDAEKLKVLKNPKVLDAAAQLKGAFGK